ncbi:hypothetical protein BF49_4192 [Bradyrhizobium sp.]|nr:hypothetical protein BF49_4192 [Bradyrhizobium sp.]
MPVLPIGMSRRRHVSHGHHSLQGLAGSLAVRRSGLDWERLR